MADDALFSDPGHRDTAAFVSKRHGARLMLTDPPVHTRLQALVSCAFTPRRIDELV